MYGTILTAIENNTLIVTINRPEKMNALNAEVLSDLDKVLDEIYENKAIRSAIITGAGAKAFVAGADISAFVGLEKAQAVGLAKRGQDIFSRIENSAKPIVAAVNGFALGGGCELAMACHFRLCSENAKFGQPEVNLGIIPGYGGTQRLTQLVGKGRSMEMQMSALIIDAAQALQFGLVNYVTTAEGLLPKAKEILQTIHSKAPFAVAKVIACINVAEPGDSGYSNGTTGLAKERECFGECFDTKDTLEGTTAFLEKRAPKFTGE